MIKKIVIEKIIIYLFILFVGVAVIFAVHMRESGYTDKNGNYVKGTLEIADEYKQQFIADVEALGFAYIPSDNDAYMTFKDDAQISSVLKIKADFTTEGVEVSDYICDIYFKTINVDTMQKTVSTIIPEMNLGAEFSIAAALAEYTEVHSTVTRESSRAYLELKPVEGFDGVVVGLTKKQK